MTTNQFAQGMTEFANAGELAGELEAAHAQSEQPFVSTPVCSAIVSASVAESVDNTFDHGC